MAADTVDEQTAPADGQGGHAPSYDHRAVERRWQAAWDEADLYLTPLPKDTDDRCAYIFTEHPVPAHSASLGLLRSYAISDSYARFMRARGTAVLFSLGFQAFGSAVEEEAIANDTTPAAWVDRARTRIGDQFRHLGFSIDWSRVSSSANAGTYQWSQLLFLTLLEKGLIHRAKDDWYLRFGGYLRENDEASAAFKDWNDLALSFQRASSGQIDGVEFEAASLDGIALTIFTPHAEAIRQAEFIAMSPNHPDIEQWLSPADLQDQLDQLPASDIARRAADVPLGVPIDTHRLVSGVGTESPIPVVVSAAVDAKFGPTAVLGIPSLDEADAKLAAQLPPPAASAWRITDNGPSVLRPARRHSYRDLEISHQRSWGTPIPVVNCEACGSVPLAAEDLPVRLPESLKPTSATNTLEHDEESLICRCPRCSGPARRETATLDPTFDGLWDWIAPCVQHISTKGLFEAPELARWLPATRAVRGLDESGATFYQRIGAKALRDAELLSALPDGEPFSGMTMHERVQKGREKEVINLDALIKRVGADAIRLTILYGAAPSTVLTWRGHTVRHCQNWLSSLWRYAMPRLGALVDLGEVNESQGAVALRRRLQRWCRTAVERVSENYEALQMHRAIRNVMTFLLRIEDFEQRAIDQHGELTPADRRALGEALLIAVQLIAPIAPHMGEELWRAAGGEGFVAGAAWPTV